MGVALVAKTAIFDDNNNVLVLTRSGVDSVRPGGFDFPGGTIDQGEDILQGAAREILEETGLHIQASEIRVLYTSTSSPNEKDTILVRLFCVAKVSGDVTVKLSHEHQSYQWLSLEDTIAAFSELSWSKGLQFALSHKLLPLA